MLPVPQDVLKRLRLEKAVTDEVASYQALIPPTPGLDKVGDKAGKFARWLQGQLRAGLSVAPQVVVSTRKVQHGVRPVPIWGFVERVTYRAIVDFLLRNEPELNRSPEAYVQFIGEPVHYARKVEPPGSPPAKGIFGELIVRSSVIHYVIKADINAFYEYVDHEILGRELLTRTGDYSAIQCLMNLLAEVQGHNYGLPQLMDPSDRLSEVYIDVVERKVIRNGWPTWRFNDDFRIAVRNFEDALAAIEDLAAAARSVGLTLNDYKTTTPRFSRYAWENFGLGIDDTIPEELQLNDPEDLVGDYTEGVGQADPTWAIDLIRDAKVPNGKIEGAKPRLDLGNVRGDDFRRIRRALAHLRRAGVADGLPHVSKLVAYVPSVTPWVVRYVIAAGDGHREEAKRTLGEVIDRVSLSDWQRSWIVRALYDLRLLEGDAQGEPSAILDWVNAILHGRHAPFVRAEAAMTLASAGAVDLADLEHMLRSLPAALSPWVLVGVDKLRGFGKVTEEQAAAIRGEGGVYAGILASQ